MNKPITNFQSWKVPLVRLQQFVKDFWVRRFSPEDGEGSQTDPAENLGGTWVSWSESLPGKKEHSHAECGWPLAPPEFLLVTLGLDSTFQSDDEEWLFFTRNIILFWKRLDCFWASILASSAPKVDVVCISRKQISFLIPHPISLVVDIKRQWNKYKRMLVTRWGICPRNIH